MQCRSRRISLFATLALALPTLSASGAALTPGSLLVRTQLPGSSTFAITEFTTAGVPLQTIGIPVPPGSQDTASPYPRDLVVDGSGRILLYNGTFDPYLSVYDPASGQWSHQTYAGWSTVNNASYGGLALLGNRVFATDMETYGEPADAQAGIVMFDLAGGTSSRFANFTEPIDLAAGLDGKLYAFDGDFATVYDPVTTGILRGFSLGAAGYDARAIAVDAAGTVYAATLNGRISRLTADGALLGSIDLTCDGFGVTTACSFLDLDVSADGRVVAGARDGTVWVTDASLGDAHAFRPDSWNNFVAFVPQTVVPVPASAWLLGSAAGALAGLRWRLRPGRAPASRSPRA